jgi:predicted dehydrogenase
MKQQSDPVIAVTHAGGRHSRREFFRYAAAVGALGIAPSILLPRRAFGAQDLPPSNRIAMGVIGAGGRGRQVLDAMLGHAAFHFVAVSDLFKDRREGAKGAVDAAYGNKDCTAYKDYRELLARADIDAVLVATGDRWHTLASITALRAGKDVYCEKPISMTLADSRALADTVKSLGRVFQAGTQRRSTGNFRYAAELARSGKLGQLRTLHCSIAGLELRDDYLPSQQEPPKEEFDWDMWLGPAPWRPYNAGYTGGMGAWRDFSDLGGGGIIDWGSHSMDLAQYATNSDDSGPVEYERVGQTVEARYASGVKIILRMNMGKSTCPIRFEGDEGYVYTDDSGQIEVNPESLRGDRSVGSEQWNKPVAHILDFIDAVRTRRLPAAHAEAAHRAVSACHIGNLCIRLGRKLRWDPVKEEFLNDEQANRLRSRAARQPWHI